MARKQLSIYTVGQVNLLIKAAIEDSLPPRFVIHGEISGWKTHSGSGHAYFALKDDSGVIPCVMWKSSLASVKFEPDNGMAVLAAGYVDVYPPQGKYQFYAEKLDLAGVGELQVRFEKLVAKLRAEGLFDEEHKKPIAPYPMRIGIVTSESGAAVRDIVDSIHNRWPCCKLMLYPARVQGEGAAAEIAAAIKALNRRNCDLKLDILIVGRGGGSLEDLWAFNEEPVARAIFASKIPVISAVGHEVDTTIADLVADARASTPTKAGVIAVPDQEEVLERIAAFATRLHSRIIGRLENSKHQLATSLASYVFRDPNRMVNDRRQQLDELVNILTGTAKDRFALWNERLRTFYEQIARIEPHRLIGGKNRRLDESAGHLHTATLSSVNTSRLRLTALESKLAAMNPKGVLRRGYSITSNKRTGKLVARADDVQIGDMVVTELAEENFIESLVRKEYTGTEKEAEQKELFRD